MKTAAGARSEKIKPRGGYNFEIKRIYMYMYKLYSIIKPKFENLCLERFEGKGGC